MVTDVVVTVKPTDAAPPQVTTAATTTLPPPTLNLTCDFEYDMCGWMLDMYQAMQWSRIPAWVAWQTTGPAEDHTTQSHNGYYMIFGVLGGQVNNTARMESRRTLIGGTVHCMTFWYHAAGHHVGTLNIIQKPVSERLLLKITQ